MRYSLINFIMYYINSNNMFFETWFQVAQASFRLTIQMQVAFIFCRKTEDSYLHLSITGLTSVCFTIPSSTGTFQERKTMLSIMHSFNIFQTYVIFQALCQIIRNQRTVVPQPIQKVQPKCGMATSTLNIQNAVHEHESLCER